METVAELIAGLDAARAQMRAVLAAVDQRRHLYGPWKIKEVLAHLTGWDVCVLDSLQAHAAGVTPPTPALDGIDAYNERSVAARTHLDEPAVRAEWERVREGLRAALLALPPDRLTQPLRAPWGPTGSVAQMIAVIYEHEAEHAAEIRVQLDAAP